MSSQVSQFLFATNPPTRLGIWLGRLLARIYRIAGRDRYDEFRVEHVVGITMLVLPTVANPRALRTGAYFASSLDGKIIPSGSEVLDLGTGSGVCALVAARRARRVVATDINPSAVRCARANVLINSCEELVELRQGDLFAPVSGERFDIVLFNPPFRTGDPGTAKDAAWYASDLPKRFAAGLAERLKPGGFCLILLSSYGDACAAFEAELIGHGFALSILAQRRWINETVTIVKAIALRDEVLPA